MKKCFIVALFLAFATPSVFSQKVVLRWVKTTLKEQLDTTDKWYQYTAYYPQVDSCAGAAKINAWLKKNKSEWCDYHFEMKIADGLYTGDSKVKITFNQQGLLSFNRYCGHESPINAKEFDHFGATFDTQTGNHLKTDDFINQNALAKSTALQFDDNCFLTKDGLTIVDYGSNQEFEWATLKPFAKKRYRYLFR